MSKPESYDDPRSVKEILHYLQQMYRDMTILARQYSLRFLYLLTKNWKAQKLEAFLEDLILMLDQLISFSESVQDMKLIFMALDRLSDSQKILRAFASDHSFQLMSCFSRYISKCGDQHTIDDLIKFVKRLSKLEASHEAIVASKVYDLIMN